MEFLAGTNAQAFAFRALSLCKVEDGPGEHRETSKHLDEDIQRSRRESMFLSVFRPVKKEGSGTSRLERDY